MPFLFTDGFDEEVQEVAEAADDKVTGGHKLDDLAAEAGFESGNAGVAVIFLAMRGNSPEIIAFYTEFFEVFDDLPLEGIGARKLVVQLGRSGFKILGLDAANQNETISNRLAFGGFGNIDAGAVVEGGTLSEEGFESGRDKMLAESGLSLNLMKFAENLLAARPIDRNTELAGATNFIAGLATHFFQEFIFGFLEIKDDGVLGVEVHRGFLQAEAREKLKVLRGIPKLGAETNENTFLALCDSANFGKNLLNGGFVLPIEEWPAGDF